MIFKEYVQSDIKNTFINESEFAGKVEINGASVSVIEDKDQLLYRIKKDYNGLVVGDVLFYISKEEYAKIPRVSPTPAVYEAVRYNGKPYTIVEANHQDGMYEITLQKAGAY